MLPMHNETAVNLLSHLFFAKKLRIMNDFFQRCQEMAAVLNGEMICFSFGYSRLLIFYTYRTAFYNYVGKRVFVVITAIQTCCMNFLFYSNTKIYLAAAWSPGSCQVDPRFQPINQVYTIVKVFI